MPKARMPRTWVTVLASQPSVSIETETTQRMEPPSWPGLPTVFMTSRSSSWSVMFSPARASPVRSMISRRKRSISSAAMPRKLSSSASPASSCSLSMSSVFGRGQRVAGGLVEVAEQGEAAVFQRGRAVLVLAVEAGDEVVDQLRDGGVLADDDEAGRHADARSPPRA